VRSRHVPISGATLLVVVAVALAFGTSIDPYSLMVLATATYFVVWLASFGVTWYGRGRAGRHPGGDADRTGDTRDDDLHPSAQLRRGPGPGSGTA
jgi:hypothetical protein